MTGVMGVSDEPMSKPSRAEARLEEAGVLPQPLDQLRLALQHVDGRQAGGRHGRRMRGREEERPRPMLQQRAQRGRSRDVAAQHADRLGERANLHMHPPVQVEVVDRAPPVAPQHAGAMRVVDVHDRLRLFGGGHDLRQPGDVAVHAEDAVGDDQHRPFGPAGRGPHLATARCARASMSPCGKIFRSALVRRMPSMMLAWLSASDTMTAPSGARIGITPVLQVKPDWKVSVASTCLKSASRASSSSCRLIVPAMVRTAPDPAPNRSTARMAASRSRGCVFRPR